MRIIGGRFKGRRLARLAPGIRPTSDRLRESLFNHLGAQVVNSRWLDAFGGSGAVGIEALSRGAASVTFNDPDPAAARLIRQNLDRCGAADHEIRQENIFRLLRSLEGEHYDYIFLDPPYAFRNYRRLLEQIPVSLEVRPGDRVILEVFKKTTEDLMPEGWQRLRTLRAGDSQIWILGFSRIRSR